MTINENHAADAINYLVAARATTVVDHQADVWADYLNYEVDDPQPDELLHYEIGRASCRERV